MCNIGCCTWYTTLNMEYEKQEFYHILNRGVDKRVVFKDTQDYSRFIQDIYLFNNEDDPVRNISRMNYPEYVQHPMLHISKQGEPKTPLVKIHAWCLMPNHYHMLVTPLKEKSLPLFMKRLNMGYSKYFNEKYDRSGALWQGKYKKIHIRNYSHFLYIPHYIHANPLDLTHPEWRSGEVKNVNNMWNKLLKYKWSSLRDYIAIKNFPSILYKEDIKEIMGSANSVKTTLISLVSDEYGMSSQLSKEFE